MDFPQRIAALSTEAVGDGLAVLDAERKQSYALNATSALVFQHCDGQTSPEQLAEILRRRLNVPPAEADQLVRLALDELQAAGLLQSSAAPMPPPAASASRREALTAFAAAGLSLFLLPMVSMAGGGGNHHDNDHDDDDDDHHDHDDDDDDHGGGHTLIPLLECVDHNNDGTFTAHFGYLNRTHRTITVPIGQKNEFRPGQPDRGQPTVFLKGEHLNAFSVVFSGDAIKWVLKARGDKRHQVVASSMSEACPTQPSPTTIPLPTTTDPLPPTTSLV